MNIHIYVYSVWKVQIKSIEKQFTASMASYEISVSVNAHIFKKLYNLKVKHFHVGIFVTLKTLLIVVYSHTSSTLGKGKS